MTFTPPPGIDTSDYAAEEPEYVPGGGVEAIPGYHVIYPDGKELRYVNDRDGYQTAYPAEAIAHNVAIGYPNG